MMHGQTNIKLQRTNSAELQFLRWLDQL